MKIVPSLAPTIAVTKDDSEVEALTAVKAVKPVQPRTLPPLVVQPRARPKASPDITEQQDRRLDVHVTGNGEYTVAVLSIYLYWSRCAQDSIGVGTIKEEMI